MSDGDVVKENENVYNRFGFDLGMACIKLLSERFVLGLLTARLTLLLRFGQLQVIIRRSIQPLWTRTEKARPFISVGTPSISE